ncbi:MAG: 30S ribosomal protein THX [Chitinophagaceae bacterium]
MQSNHSFKTIIKMGRGDKKTAKGKRFMGSFGVSRPHKTATTAPKAAAAPAAPAAPAKKATKAKA